MNKTMRRIFQSIMLLLLVSLPIAMLQSSAAIPIYSETSTDIIRLHIIAEDDSLESQVLKLKLRDAVLTRFGASLAQSSFDDARRQIVRIIGDIETYSNEILASFGFDGSCAATFSYQEFPDRTYAGITVPAGTYDSLIIRIGKAEGRNWWCVMYPPLCLLSADTPVAADIAFSSIGTIGTIDTINTADSTDSHIYNNDSFIYMDRTKLPQPSKLAALSRSSVKIEKPAQKTTFGNGLFYSAVFEWIKNIF
jgi:stage II sporulation protein R